MRTKRHLSTSELISLDRDEREEAVLPTPVSLLEHRRQLLLDIDWTIGQLAAAKALILSAKTGVAPLLEFTSNKEARFFEEQNRADYRQPASLVQLFAQSPLADADLNLERDRARRTLFKRLRRQPALNLER